MSRALLAALAGLLLLPAASDAARNKRQISAKILSGSVAAPGQFPWMAVLMDAGAERAVDGAYCGGTVIAPRVVLTAAHCVQGQRARQMHVVVGRTRLTQEQDGQRIAVAKIVIHPEWNPSTMLGDAALLQLSEAATVTPLPIAHAAEDGLVAPGAPVMTMGWGATFEGGRMNDELLYVRLVERAAPACKRIYDDYDDTQQLCVGSDRRGEDSCQGDSGGPIVAGEAEAMRIFGIVSYGRGCGRRNIPGVYTRVSAVASWIDEQAPILNGDVPPPPPPPPDPPVVRIGRIACEAIYCNVFLRTTGRAPSGGIALNFVRRRQGNRGPVDDFVFARQLSARKWVARANLPFGRLILYAIPFNEDMSDLDGDGDAERVLISHA
jgi:secreted trypsin-like serine protease